MAKQETANDVEIRQLSDIVAQVAGPALAILAVASVAFFLIEVTYSGGLVGRVKWIFGLFSFAAVLISRISIQDGYERANGYGFLLGVATLLVTARFMQGNIIGLSLILAFVWWVASRLTWDCTFLDKTRDASGQGMIDLAVDRVSRFRAGKRPEENLNDGFDGQAERYAELTQPLDSTGQPKPLTAWDHIVRIFFRRRQANTPGLWAFYFLLGGLPLFGIGQIFLGYKDEAGHSAAIFHFSVYIIALLGLLMLTSVLGLHRYLKKNQSAIPASIARKWILTGTLLALGIVGFCFMLPRPTPEYSLNRWFTKFNSGSLDPSKRSAGKDGQKQGENSNVDSGPSDRDQGQEKGEQSDQNGNGGNKQQSESGQSEDRDGAENGGGNAKGEEGSGGDQKESSKSSGNNGDESESSQQQDGRQQSEQGEENSQGKAGEESGDDASKQESEQDEGLKIRKQQRRQREEENEKLSESEKSSSSSSSSGRSSRNNQDQESENEDQESQSSASPPPSSSAMKGIMGLIRMLFWMVMLAAIAFFAIRNRSQIGPWLRSFLAELAGIWARLFGPKKKKKPTTVDGPLAAKESKRRLPAFASFRDPFTSGVADSWSNERLITYTMGAFEAWARDQGCPREPEQTVFEFATKTARDRESLWKDAKHLVELYTQLAYAKGQENGIARQSVLELSALWARLTSLYSPTTNAVAV